MRFLGLARIGINQICTSHVISNKKRISEGIGYLSNFLKIRMSENRTTEICRSQGPGVVQFFIQFFQVSIGGWVQKQGGKKVLSS